MQEEKLMQTTEAHVVENVRVDIEVQDQVKGEVVASSKEKIEVDMEIQEPENRGIDRVDQLLQVENEEANSKETNKEFDHMMDPISSPPLENQIKPSYEKTIDREIVKEDHIIELPHIDFVLGDRPILPGECVQIVGIQELKLHFIRARIIAKSSHQK